MENTAIEQDEWVDLPYDSGEDDWVDLPEEKPVGERLTEYFTPKERTAKDISQMSLSEKLQFSQELAAQREFGSAKGKVSGATLGLSQLIPGLKQNEGDVGFGAGELQGSLLPIGKLYNFFGSNLTKLAAKSPIAQKSLSHLANITGAALTGASVEAFHEVGQGKLPDANKVAEEGALWSLIDLGLTGLGAGGRFVKALITGAKKTGEGVYGTLENLVTELKGKGLDSGTPEKVAQSAIDLLSRETKPLKIDATKPFSPINHVFEQATKKVEDVSRIANKEISHKDIQKSFKNVLETAKPESLAPVTLETAESELNKSAKKAFEDSIESQFPRSESSQKLGKDVQKALNESFEFAEKDYVADYEAVEKAASKVKVQVNNLATEIQQVEKNLTEIATEFPGQKKVIDTIKSVLEDIGHVKAGEGLEMVAEVPLDKLIKVNRRLSKIVKYDVDKFSITNELKPIRNAIKKEIKKQLGKLGGDTLGLFEKAQSSFRETAETFGKENIRKLRGSELPESVLSSLNTASEIEYLKKALPSDKFKHLEREVLEKVNSKTADSASKYLREVKGQLSPEAQKLGQQIVESKLGGPTSRNKLSENILAELHGAFETGKVPTKTLKLWKTPQGQKKIRSALKNQPNSEEIVQYLQDKSTADFAASIINPNGSIKWDALNSVLENPEARKQLYLSSGKQALQVFDNLGLYRELVNRKLRLFEPVSRNFEKGLPVKSTKGSASLERRKGEIESHKQGKFAQEHPLVNSVDNLVKDIGPNGKLVAALLSALGIGVAPTIGVAATLPLIYKLATRPRALNAFKAMANTPTSNASKFTQQAKILGNELSKAD